MTEKLDPGWVKDRLPTEGDGDYSGDVVVCRSEVIEYENFKQVKENVYWCNACYDDNVLDLSNIFKPEECLDREKGGTNLSNEEVKAINQSGLDMRNKIEDLEQALAKSEERVKHEERRVGVKNGDIKKYKDACDKLYEDNLLLKQFLIKEWE